MIDIKFLRENPDAVKENIKKKFQDYKLPLVDQVIELDEQSRAVKKQADELRSNRNKISKQIGSLMAQGKKEEGMALKEEVTKQAEQLAELEKQESDLSAKVTEIMMQIPNIIDPSVPIGKDDSQNVEIEKFGDPFVPDFEIPYHTEIMEKFNGIDLDSARKVAGNGFYYLMGDIARLHSAVIAYARDFMINRGFTYCVPPFMIRSDVVTGVMSFAEMDSMMYKIEGEDLYLIGTSEHSMIGKFIDTINKEENLPYTLTSYSPCFRKEKGAHGIEERGVYRIHQFEKQEMIVVCKPEDSKMWFDKLWQITVDLFRSMDIPVRTLECCRATLLTSRFVHLMLKPGHLVRRNILRLVHVQISVTHRLAALKSELQARTARNTLHILLTTRLLHLRECSLRSLRTTLTKTAQSGFLRLFVLTWAVWRLSSNQHTVFSQGSANYSKYQNKIILTLYRTNGIIYLAKIP